tara:strand:+ start:2120 stop:5617 length:3498 start_codon:yes stop_codon:yes gene_type:complete
MINTLFHYDNNTLNINYIKKNTIIKTIKFQNNKIKPKIQKKKKENDDNLLDILNETNEENKGLIILPINTISDLKKHISVMFDIPWYKITIYWYVNNLTKTSYNIYVDDNLYNISFENINDIDTYLYNNKNDIYISSYDEILTMNYFILNNIKDIYFITIDDYINMLNLQNNKMNMDYIYFNLIIKYFPMFTYDLFYNYIFYNSDFGPKYRDLINIGQHIIHYNKLNDLLYNQNEPNYNLIFKYKKIIFNFNNIIKTKQGINIRNIFDILHIGDFNILKMVFVLNNKMYKKENKFDEDIKKYKSEINYNTLTIFIKNHYNVPNKPMFLKILKNGNIEIVISISEQYDVTMDEIIKYIQKEINPILELLDKHKFIFNIFSSINNISNSIIKSTYESNIKCSIVQKINDDRFNNTNNFNKIMDSLSNYDKIYNKITKDENDIINLYMHSGIVGFNVDHFHNFYPDKKNYYSIYSSTKDMSNWKDKYTGLLIKLIYNMNFLEIDIKNINYNDIKNILYILNSIIYNIDTKKTNNDLLDKDKKIKKLKAVDPVMFSFEHSKTSHRKYSKICQKPFHPIIYTKDEIKNMPNDTKQKLIEFINATTKEKVYYNCNSKKAPYLGFIVNEHPNNYCIPCCRVKKQLNKDNYDECLKNYTYNKKQDKSDKYIGNYILKNIVSNRLSELPPILNMIFNKSFSKKYINTKPFYIYGIQGLINVINFSNNLNINDINMIHKYKINLFIFDQNGEFDINYYFKYDNYTLIYFDGLYYYPIVNTLENKNYTNNNDIIKFFIDILKKNESISNSSFFHFEYIDKHFKIEHIYVNNKNYIYGVLINEKGNDIYIPIIYYFNSTNYKVYNTISNSTINNISEENIIKFLTKYDFDNNINKYIYSNVLNKYIGMSLNFNSYTLIFLFKPIKHDDLYFDVTSIEIQTIFYPIHLLSEKIINNEYSISLNEFPLNLFDIYYKNIYQLILHEISYYFNLNKNNTIRNDIIGILKKNNDYNVISVTIQSKIPTDHNDIMLLINEYIEISNNKIIKNNTTLLKFENELYKTKYAFDDDVKYDFIKNANYNDVDKLFDKLFLFKPINQIKIKHKIKNILIPCKLDNNNDYCNNNKLIIPLEYKNKFISLFYYDIKNTFKNTNLLNDIMYIDDFDQFDIKLNEIISIEPY